MSVFNVISMLGGLALFLYGMRIMGDALTKSSSGAMKRAMEKVTNNPIISFLLGLGVTAIIQSSTATIVITSGLVGAGILTLHQSIGIILGANVGTTVTGQIIRLLDIGENAATWLNFFKPSTLAPIAAIIGILLIMAFKFHNSDTIGTIALGFGILFTGLLNMTGAVTSLSESESFRNLFITFGTSPFLGFVIGTAVATLLQSSSASIGILQSLAMTGLLTFNSIYPIILGIYLGDSFTTFIVCTIGAKEDAKRTGVIHILYNLSKIAVVFAVMSILHATGVLDNIWNMSVSSGAIANTNTIFNFGCAVVLMPLAGFYEKLSRKIVPDKAAAQNADSKAAEILKSLDEVFFTAPELAFNSVHKTVSMLAEMARHNVSEAMIVAEFYNEKQLAAICESEETIDVIADNVSDYLVALSPHVRADDNSSKRLNYYMKAVIEFERIGDHAINLTESATELTEKQYNFSGDAKKELTVLGKAIRDIMDKTIIAFENDDVEAAKAIEPIEEVIDKLVATLRNNHIERLSVGCCNVETGFVFSDILTNIERISDQCSNIALATLSLNNEIPLEHDYIQHLHIGEDPEFNAAYAKATEYYFSQLETIGEN